MADLIALDVEEDEYSYDKTTYDELVAAFLENEATRQEIEAMRELYPEALNLVCRDWDVVLRNSSVFNKWESLAFKLTETIRVPNQFVCYKFPAQHHAKLLLVCEILYGVSRKVNAQANNKNKTKKNFDICRTGPIQLLTKAFAKFRNYNCYNYATVLLPNCNNIHVGCHAQTFRETKTSFSVSNVKLFNGTKAGKVTPIFLESKNLKSFVGVAIVDLTGFTGFKDNFNTIKLSGVCHKLLITMRSCLQNKLDGEDIIFDIDPQESDKRKREEEFDVLVPENIVPPSFFASTYQISKKSRFIEDK
jgi:hypothetical protein